MQTLESVIFQTYSNIELIIFDDASTDKSVAIIEKFIQEIPQYQNIKIQNIPIQFIKASKNSGICKAFNQALHLAKGKYIMDLATDDVLLDDRIEKQVQIFESLPENYAVVFSNATLINEKGDILGYHFPIDKSGKSIKTVASDDVYTNVLKGYFICTPTMMMRKMVLDELGGYDENLTFEDFDFWVRSSRKSLYHYQDEITTLKRVVKNSLSTRFYQLNDNPHLRSVLIVLEKARLLNQNEMENQILAQNTLYHLRQAFFVQDFGLVKQFNLLFEKLNPHKKPFWLAFILFLNKYHIKVFTLYRFYFWLRGFGKRWKI